MQHLLQPLVAFDDGVRVVAWAGRLDFVGGQTEQKEVVLAGFGANLDVGAVQGADGQGPVHHHLHIAGARCLLAGGGDLLGEVGGRADRLHGGHPVIRQKSDPQAVADFGVLVDHLSHVVDQLDDQLGHGIAGCSLAAEEYAARWLLLGFTELDGRIQMDHVQDVE